MIDRSNREKSYRINMKIFQVFLMSLLIIIIIVAKDNKLLSLRVFSALVIVKDINFDCVFKLVKY
jgi:hypothetical protein